MVGGAVVGGRVVINAQNGSGEVVVSWGWGKNHLKSLGTPHAVAAQAPSPPNPRIRV